MSFSDSFDQQERFLPLVVRQKLLHIQVGARTKIPLRGLS